MSRSLSRLSRGALAGALLVLVLAGCEASVDIGGGVSSDEVAKEAETQLNKVTRDEGFPLLSDVTCPDDLDDEVGAKMTCYGDAEGEKVKIVATVESVKGSTVNIDFEAEGVSTSSR